MLGVSLLEECKEVRIQVVLEFLSRIDREVLLLNERLQGSRLPKFVGSV
jgi:hypothetical protein